MVEFNNEKSLFFLNSNGEAIFLCNVCDNKQAFLRINDFLEKHNFKSYYVRTWEENGELWIDVGSHTEFFILRNEVVK